MAENVKFARYAKQAVFDAALAAGTVPDGAVCFVEETGQIWVNGVWYTLDDDELVEKITAALGDGYYSKEEITSLLSGKQDKITAGTGLQFDGETLNCTVDGTLFVVVTSLPSSPASGDEKKIHLVPLSTTGTDNRYAEYLWVDGAWEKFGELTTSAELSGYYTSAQIDSLLSGKQDKLTAGDNVSISGSNVISSIDTGATSIRVSGEAPLSLSGSYSDSTREMTISGSVDTYSKSEIDDKLSTATGGGITDVTVSGTAPLTLTGSVANNALTITGSVANATASTAGVVKPYSVLSSSPSCNSVTTTSGRYYRISTNSSNVMIVNVPWTDTTYTAGEGIKISSTNEISCDLDLSDYVTTSSLAAQLDNYLPLTGGTITGNLTVKGTTTLNLEEKDDAETVVVADSSGRLYSMPVSALGGDGVTVTVVPMPEAATVTINGVERTSVVVEAGTRVEWTVERAGYVTRRGSLTAERDVTVTVQLEWAEGVFVAISNGTVNRVVPWRDYTKTSSGESVEGVWVSDGRHGVLLALEQKKCSYWCASDNSSLDYGGALTTSEREAFGGFTGEVDAEMMRKNMSSSTLTDTSVAVGYCMTYGTSHVPVGEWRMMCGGEADMIAARVCEVNSAMSKCGGTLIADGNESSSSGTLSTLSYYWLSDQYSTSQVWGASGMLSAPAVVAVDKRFDYTDVNFSARAVSAFDF